MPTAEAVPGAPPPPSQLGTKVSRGLGWSLLGQALSRVGVFVSGIVLARLLLPVDMGEVAAALLVVNVAMGINELGVIPALVRWNDDLPYAAATATTLAVVNSCLVYLVCFVAAPLVSQATNTPGSVWVIRVMALTVLVDGLIAVPLAMLYRELRTVPQTIAEVGGMALYVGVSVGLASLGVDAMALAWGRAVGALATGAIVIAVSRWPSRPGFDRSIARRLVRYGLPLALSTAVFEAVMSVDYLIVGRAIDAAALGVYLLAFNLSSWPVSVVSTAISRVSFSGYAALADDQARFVRGFVYSMAVAISCTLPLVIGLGVLAPELVQLLYGDTWSGAIAPLRWLVVVGGLRVLLQMAGEAIAVQDRTMVVLQLRLLWLVLLPVPLYIGAEFIGLEGVGIGHVAVALLIMVPLFVVQLGRSGIPPTRLAAVLPRPLAAGGVMLITMALASTVLEGTATRLIGIGVLAAASYTLVIVPKNDNLSSLLRQLRGRAAEPAAVTP